MFRADFVVSIPDLVFVFVLESGLGYNNLLC